MEKVEIELFLYDKFMIVENLKRFFKHIEIIEHKPCFITDCRLYISGTKYFKEYHLFQQKRYYNFCFGAYVKILLRKDEVHLLEIMNLGKVKTKLKIRLIHMYSTNTFLTESKFDTLDYRMCDVFLSQDYKLKERRSALAGHFAKEFLIAF